MTAVSILQQQHIVLHVTWEGYVSIGEALRDQPVRMTYHQGALEIMTLSLEHEWVKKLIARLLECFFLEMEIEVHSGGSTTFKRELLDGGLEADECYWIQHEEQIRGKSDYHQDDDPPPDLALEVEISRGIIKRLPIYAALKFPEIWRYDEQAIEVLLLDSRGQYKPSASSKALPMLPVAELARFLELRHSVSETQVVRQFRDWVRQQSPEWAAKKTRGRKKK